MKLGQRAYAYYEDLPVWGKAVVVIGGGAVAWFSIISPIVKLVKRKLDLGKKVKEGHEAGQQLAALIKKGIKPTISEAQAESMANSMRISFSGCGTDEDAIYGVMSQLNNDADVYRLINTYGVRKYIDCPVWSFGFGAGTTEQTLSGAISDELGAMEKRTVNGILAKKPITFRFT